MLRTLSAILIFLVTVTGSHVALATSFTTIFGPGGVAGNPPDPSVLNGMDTFTQFNGGEILFFQNGNFYVGGAGPAAGNPLSAQVLASLGGPQVNNRSFGVAGPDAANIFFTSGIVQEVILQVRGTTDAFSIGPTAPGTTFPNNTPLGDAFGVLQVFTDLGLQATGPIPNADYTPLTLASGGTFNGQTINGGSITQLSLINARTANSAVTPVAVVPKPTTVLLFGSGLVGFALWRLRTRRQAEAFRLK